MTRSQVSSPAAVALVSDPTGGTFDDSKLFYARRALTLLRTRLGRQGLLDLLGADITDGVAAMREAARVSEGRFTSGTTVLAAEGLTAGEFVRWMATAFDDENVLLSAQPEHYVMTNQDDGTVHIVENVGPHILSFYLGDWASEAMAWAADAEELLPESEFPFKKATNMFLADGTIVGRVMIQFGDSPEGFTASLTVFLPTAAPDEVVEHHMRHFAVEFRNWIVAAAAAHAGAKDRELT